MESHLPSNPPDAPQLGQLEYWAMIALFSFVGALVGLILAYVRDVTFVPQVVVAIPIFLLPVLVGLKTLSERRYEPKPSRLGATPPGTDQVGEQEEASRSFLFPLAGLLAVACGCVVAYVLSSLKKNPLGLEWFGLMLVSLIPSAYLIWSASRRARPAKRTHS